MDQSGSSVDDQVGLVQSLPEGPRRPKESKKGGGGGEGASGDSNPSWEDVPGPGWDPPTSSRGVKTILGYGSGRSEKSRLVEILFGWKEKSNTENFTSEVRGLRTMTPGSALDV